MKRLSNYIFQIGLIMAVVSMAAAVAYHFTSLEFDASEKLNLATLYYVGAAMTIGAGIYKLFKEPK